MVDDGDGDDGGFLIPADDDHVHWSDQRFTEITKKYKVGGDLWISGRSSLNMSERAILGKILKYNISKFSGH